MNKDGHDTALELWVRSWSGRLKLADNNKNKPVYEKAAEEYLKRNQDQ